MAADALGVVDVDESSVLVLRDGTSRAHRGTRSLGAVLAGTTVEDPVDGLLPANRVALLERLNQARVAVQVCRVLKRTGELVLVGANRGRQVIPHLAGNLAALAVRAQGGVVKNSHFSHVLPPPYAFSMLTRNALYSGTMVFGSPTFGVRSFTVSPVPYRCVQPKWCVRPT